MTGFPDKFRDLTAFSGDGLDYSTSSNTAVKMFDALVNQVRLCVLLLSCRCCQLSQELSTNMYMEKA